MDIFCSFCCCSVCWNARESVNESPWRTRRAYSQCLGVSGVCGSRWWDWFELLQCGQIINYHLVNSSDKTKMSVSRKPCSVIAERATGILIGYCPFLGMTSTSCLLISYVRCELNKCNTYTAWAFYFLERTVSLNRKMSFELVTLIIKTTDKVYVT